MTRIVLAAVVVLLLPQSANAQADSLTDNLGPREIALGEALRGGAIGSSAITLNPAGVGLNREMVFEAGYGYRGSDSASMFNLSACDSTGMPGCFFYNYIGAAPGEEGMQTNRRAHSAGLTIARAVNPRLLIGSTVRYLNYKSDASPMAEAVKNSGFNWDLGMTLRMSEMFNLAVTGHNIKGVESTQFPRAIGAGALVRPFRGLTVTADARWNTEQSKPGRYGGGIEYFFTGSNGQTAFPVRGGFVYDRASDTTFASAGIGIATMKMNIDIGARRQMRGGEETLVLASLRFYGPRVPQGEPFAQ